jgi:hydroxymethylpyrimidine pyrophosphatase-like HAD family hydrolase
VHTSAAAVVPPAGYRHEAFLYRSQDEFFAEALAFVRRGVAEGDPVMVALAEPHLSVMRTALGADGESVQFADMASLGANPARILPAWLRFVEQGCGGGRRARGLGEPIWPGRRPAEVAECYLHEALLNVGLPPDAPLWLRCPYDAEHLGSAVLREVAASHPFLLENGACRASNSYGGPNLAETVFRSALPEPAVPTVDLPFGSYRLSAVRDLVMAHAESAGVGDHLADELTVAIEGLAASSLRHGAGSGAVRLWREPEAVVCEVRDAGCIDDPLAGRRTAEPERSRGRAIKEANQLCDLVQVRSNLHGTAVRVHTWLPGSAGAGSTGSPPAAAVPDSGSGPSAPRVRPQAPGCLRVLVSDLDGTLTDGGPVAADLLDALDRARARGVLVVLVTGRRLRQLDDDHPGLRRHMDAAVLENGAVLLGPRGPRLLAPPVPRELTDALTRHGVPHHTGEVLVDCDARDAHRVLDALADTGLDHQMVRNRAALMVLPAGVTKATGLTQALAELGLDGHNAVAVGDAENDLRLFDACEIAVAVANAAPALRAQADVVLPAPAGEGVLELLRGPLLQPGTTLSSRRWRMTLGHADGVPVQLPASPSQILVTGDSGAGKSFLTGLIVEQLAELQYSALVIDPEGDHAPLSRQPGIMTLGRDGHLPPPGLLLDLLAHGPATLVLDLSQQRLGDAGPLRSESLAAVLRDYFTHLAEAVRDSRHQAGRPHWLLVDEADSLFTDGGPLLPLVSPGWGLCLTTYRPERLAPRVHVALQWTVRMDSGAPGTATLLDSDATATAVRFTVSSRRSPHVRHRQKYAEGSALRDRPFVFRDDRGPVGLTAVNIDEFTTALRRVPLEVITHHMRRRDFTRWILDVLGDTALADLVHAVELSVAGGADPHTNRNTVVALLERRYLEKGHPAAGVVLGATVPTCGS